VLYFNSDKRCAIALLFSASSFKRFLLISFASLVLNTPLFAQLTEEELEQWFNEEEYEPVQAEKDQLIFLTDDDINLSERPVLHSSAEIIITQNSLESGWVKLAQCYKHLDAVSNTEIIYQYRQIRNLKITDSKNIEKAEVKTASVKLANVSDNARICISAEVNILNKLTDSIFSLNNGPYHLKFLDGYFPFHVSLSIDFPEKLLTLKKTEPINQPGFRVNNTAGTLNLDSYFAGQLLIKIFFERL
jgi:hypothetical protein